YAWSYTGGTGVTINGTGNSVTLDYSTTATSGTLSVTATNGCGTSSAMTIDVIVNSGPVVMITDPAAVCSPSAIDLTDPAITSGSDGGLTFTYWTDATATTSLVGETAVGLTGTYYIKGDNGTCSTIMPVDVTISEAPNVIITDPAAVCSPSTVDLTDPAITSGSDGGLIFTYWTDATATTSLIGETAVGLTGTYYIKGDNGTCSTIMPVDVTISSQPNVIINNPAAVCSPSPVDLTDPAITSGSDSGLTFTYWTDATATIPLAGETAVTISGTYYIKGDNGTCSTIKPVSVTINAQPTVTITDPIAVCAPSTVDLTAAAITGGSDAGLTYTYWTDAAATIVLTGETSVGASGTYYIKGDNGTCSTIEPVNVTINSQPLLTIIDPAAVCSPSTVDLTAAAITAGSDAGLVYTYWTDAAGMTPLVGENAVAISGTYYIKGDNGTCSIIKPVVVTINALLPVSVSITADNNPVCSGNSVTFTATPVNEGTAPLYEWHKGATTVGTNSSTYSYVPSDGDMITVVLTSSEVCQTGGPATSNLISVGVNPAINITAVPVHALCNGYATGEITVNVTGGTAPYTYSWVGADVNPSSQNQDHLAAGTYTVTVTDGASCSSSLSIVINQPLPVTGTIVSQNDILVYGETNGSVEVAGSGGTGPYQYKLGGGTLQATGLFESLSAGDYIITIQDVNGCNGITNVTITQPSGPLSGSIVAQTAVTCYGTSTGTVTVEGSGGLPPYSYSINGTDWQYTTLIDSLARGNYSVTIKDAANTTVSVPVTIYSPEAAVGANIVSQTPVLCFGGNTGSVTLTGTGGVAPYKYRIENGPYQDSGTFENLAAGSHTMTVIDSKLCTYVIDVTITEPAVLKGTVTSQINVTCLGAGNGTVTVAGSGGIGPYQYRIDGATFQAGGSFSSLLPGNHVVTIRDVNLCSTEVSISITEPDALVVTASATDVLCPDDLKGTINLTITGGTQPYNTYWSDGVTGAGRTNVKDGEYHAVVTDLNGCAASVDATIGVIGSAECLQIPEIITPNGDGFNDTWKIRNIDIFPDAEVMVYNRWGKKVYESRNLLASPWDGTMKGKVLPTDSYHYILDLHDGSKPRSGVISIIK
ncbi:MAG TPA: gliding motility-associated C-terminal domain-containing protein, partial [Bacteroidales bacterium]|nr:gliding motility-associated C-terminal domain-containing protein [Bacteroidales bacterium]